jgi:rare lipoprotein A
MKRALIIKIAIAALSSFAILTPPLAAAQESPGPNKAMGAAACYSRRLIGHKTSSGQRYNPNALTAAHATIPLGTRVKVTNVENGEVVIVLVNDRLSVHAGGGIIIDISQRACKELNLAQEEKPGSTYK